MSGDLPETELEDDELDDGDELDDDEEESFLFTCASACRSAAFLWLGFFGNDNDCVPGIFFLFSCDSRGLNLVSGEVTETELDDEELDDDDELDDDEFFLFTCATICRLAAFLWLGFFGNDNDCVPGIFLSLSWDSIEQTLVPGELLATELEDDDDDDEEPLRDDDEEDSLEEEEEDDEVDDSSSPGSWRIIPLFGGLFDTSGSALPFLLLFVFVSFTFVFASFSFLRFVFTDAIRFCSLPTTASTSLTTTSSIFVVPRLLFSFVAPLLSPRLLVLTLVVPPFLMHSVHRTFDSPDSARLI